MKRNTRKFRLALTTLTLVALVLAVFGAVPALAQTATLQVNAVTGTIHTGDACPDPRDSAIYADIQAAINCAVAGDTINVAAGTYNPRP